MGIVYTGQMADQSLTYVLIAGESQRTVCLNVVPHQGKPSTTPEKLEGPDSSVVDVALPMCSAGNV